MMISSLTKPKPIKNNLDWENEPPNDLIQEYQLKKLEKEWLLQREKKQLQRETLGIQEKSILQREPLGFQEIGFCSIDQYFIYRRCSRGRERLGFQEKKHTSKRKTLGFQEIFSHSISILSKGDVSTGYL